MTNALTNVTLNEGDVIIASRANSEVELFKSEDPDVTINEAGIILSAVYLRMGSDPAWAKDMLDYLEERTGLRPSRLS